MNYTLVELIKLYRQCEKELSKYSDRPVTFNDFINWLEENLPRLKAPPAKRSER